MTPEGAVKKEIRKILDEFGAWVCSPMGTGYGRSGIPDLIAVCHGMFVAIEAKAGDNKPTALQERELKRIREAGGHALVINEANLHELRKLLERIRCQQS